MSETNEQLTRIEIKLVYIEDFMNKLQSIALEHTESIDKLRSENRALRAKMGEIEDGMQEFPQIKPPHY